MSTRAVEARQLAAGLLNQRQRFIQSFVSDYVRSVTSKYVVANCEAADDEVRMIFGRLMDGKRPRNIDAMWIQLENLDEVRQCRRLYSTDCTLPSELLWDALYKIGSILDQQDEAALQAENGSGSGKIGASKSKTPKELSKRKSDARRASTNKIHKKPSKTRRSVASSKAASNASTMRLRSATK